MDSVVPASMRPAPAVSSRSRARPAGRAGTGPPLVRSLSRSEPTGKRPAIRIKPDSWLKSGPRAPVTMPEMSESSSKDRVAAVRAYAANAMGCPVEAVTAVAPFGDGNRHAVHRVSYRDASGAARDVVVRVSYGGDASDLAQAEREAAVLENVGGVAAPELFDFRRTSDWFDTPAMCIQFLPGCQQDLQAVGPAEIGQLASLVAWVHERPIDGLGDSMGTATTIASYADGRLRAARRPRRRNGLHVRPERAHTIPAPGVLGRVPARHRQPLTADPQ